MIMLGFSVRDEAVGAFLPLFFARSKGEAIRSFSTAVQDSSHQFYKHKGDYALFLVCGFDDSTGYVESFNAERVLSAIEVATE